MDGRIAARLAVDGRFTRLLLGIVVAAIPCFAQASGVALSRNFNVLAPDQGLANAVLTRAESFRREIAKEWLGEDLPAGAGPAMITVTESRDEDVGLTWPIDNSQREYHKVWLRTSRQRALGSTLRHEIVHVVFATRFPDRLPVWVEEGIAGLSDDAERARIRQARIAELAHSGDWPRLETLFQERRIAPSHQANYSISTSLVEYLLSRGDKRTLLRFAATGKKEGWATAVNRYYGLPSVPDLEAEWQAWADRIGRSPGSRMLPVAHRLPAPRPNRP